MDYYDILFYEVKLMRFYKMILKTIPMIYMAHSYETTAYDLSFKKMENKIEISYIELGNVKKQYEDGQNRYCEAPCINVSFYNKASRNISDAPLHRHYTFAMNAEYDLFYISAENVMKSWHDDFSNGESNILMAIMPECITDKKCVDIIEPYIKKIIYRHSINTSAERLLCVSDVFTIFSKITAWSVAYAASMVENNASPEETVYCTRAAKYIAENIDKKLYVSDVANSIGLSVGYLSRMFKAATGYCLIDYINRQKINTAKQLFENKTLSVRDAAQAVGIVDEKYFCRIFKRYSGMTTSEYKEIVQIRA